MTVQQNNPSPSTPLLQHRRRPSIHNARNLFWKVAAFVLLCAISAAVLFPALWMLSTALKPDTQVYANPPVWIPDPLRFDNFTKAWSLAPFTRYAINTSLYAVAVVFGTVLSSSLAAYGFAKLRFPGRNFLFAILLSTMMIPGMVTLIPQYILFSKLQWVGTYLPLVVPSFFAGAFFTFLLRQFFMGIPNEFSEAARVDGASDLWIWSRVIMPLSKPALATVAIFTFEGAWDSYVGPLLYLNDERLYTLQVGLQFFRTASQVQWQYLMAAALLVMLPVIIVFYSFQKYFVEGASVTGGVKG
ncbi:carbohydrate ABC transporter permease [Deinococcus peraridilitoris]|uniref:ABC-type sugar transport system, permease component n=1 Tax=Deinococcus peraridilitoris (strain DSM 19664 / LMG 22246 / CIP 109416 / KR-200) TaxID=937777 RepID=K9ZVM3_DEIPD|nr:carbohydrate ABC transporter permease [Deinococcus peraridilitoris]AFZ65653.1 ABC-type sugar transport system, permease component [Deinococcus peraridilitoris DSM 19664]